MPLNKLIEMLRYKRPAGSKTEAQFIDKFIDVVPGVYRDEFGNRIKKVGESEILWSSHTDSVHTKGGQQKVRINGDYVSVAGKNPECLGADDCAGVWLMLEMIKAGVSGTYVFHREEEIGGNGSTFINFSTPELLQGIKFAVALDRRGTKDVITHQLYRTSSDAFAHSLANQLGLGLKPSKRGVFTDTANYSGVVPECSNISVGYENEHSHLEVLNIAYLQELSKKLSSIKEELLVCDRIPEQDYDSTGIIDCSYTSYDNPYYHQSEYLDSRGDLRSLVYDHPDAAYRMLKMYGITANDFLEEIYRNSY